MTIEAIDYSRMRTIRQGDVFFIPVGGADYVEKHSGRNSWDRVQDVEGGIIQRGESTGHAHRLEDTRRGFLKKVGSGLFVVVAGALGAKVIHEEHKPVTLEPDTTYQVQIAREFDYGAEEASFVRD